MSKTQHDEWIDLTDTNQSDFLWAFRNHECPKYIFAEDYDRQKVKDNVLKTHRVKDAIEKYQRETGIDSNTAYTEASNIIDEISHAFSLKTIRFMVLILIKAIRQLFQKVLVNKDGIEMFRECTKYTPIVLAPTHNSYFDFILASYICFAMDLPLPAIVAGQDFLNMTIVNHLLRGSGAFYMRRSFASDSFYRSLFTEYTQQVLCSGERPVEFFPEGTRSRCGKAIQPKLGLLSMVLESFFHGFVQDVSFIPMSISYEKITEEQLYMYELLGIPKPKESLSGLIKARSVLKSDFGTVFVHFGKAMSLREYCLGKIDGLDYIAIPRCERHLKIFGREAQEMRIAKYFGEKIVYNQQNNMVIFPRAIVAAVMLQKKSISIDDLTHTVDQMGKLLHNFGYTLCGFEGILTDDHKTISKAVNYSDLMLAMDSSNLVSLKYEATDGNLRQTKLAKAFDKDDHLLAASLGYVYLSMQRNKLLHGCLHPLLLLHSMKLTNNVEECRTHYLFLCKIFKIEFIFDPDKDLNQTFDEYLETLSNLTLVSKDGNLLFVNEDKRNEVEFLEQLLQPFIDSYLIIMHCLSKQSFELPASLKYMAGELQLRAAEVIKLTTLDTFESLSLHTLSNAVTSLCKNGLINTVKNAKFESLINSFNTEELVKCKHTLAQFASSRLRLFTEQSRL